MTNDELISKFPYFSSSISKKYWHDTELDNFTEDGKKPFNPSIYIDVNYKGYPRFERVGLPLPSKLSDFHSIMMNRRSTRSFVGERIKKKDLATLLYYANGLRNKLAPDIGNRFYPSGGARYPLEIYPIILKGEALKKGIYHYHVKSHSLEFMWSYDDLEDRVFSNIKQSEFRECSCILVITAVSNRTEAKYGPRGLRLILMEVGHVCQNLYLAASGLGLGICSVGGFLDNGFNAILDVDGYIEKTQIILPVGKMKGGDNSDE